MSSTSVSRLTVVGPATLQADRTGSVDRSGKLVTMTYPANDADHPLPPPSGDGSGNAVDPDAPHGRDPVTGRPFSSKSKVLAGLLQLLGLVGILGFGRIYAGHTKLGVIQLIVGLLTVGIVAIIWGLIDAVLCFTGRVVDGQGRPLRDGL